MSRIGRKPITIPKGVDVNVSGDTVTVKGPKGTLEQVVTHGVTAKVDGETLTVETDGRSETKKFHGLYRSLLANCITGVTEGFKKDLIITGVGFRAQIKGNSVDLSIGFCHNVEVAIPEGLTCTAKTATELEISGIDKQLVGQFASRIRKLRPPEPYKGKGIRYSDEVIRRKAGKAMA